MSFAHPSAASSYNNRNTEDTEPSFTKSAHKFLLIFNVVLILLILWNIMYLQDTMADVEDQIQIDQKM